MFVFWKYRLFDSNSYFPKMGRPIAYEHMRQLSELTEAVATDSVDGVEVTVHR